MKILLILVLLIIAGLGCAAWYTVPKLLTPAPTVYQTSKLDRGEMAVVVSATGSVEATSTVKVGSQVSGRVKEVLVEDDQSVTKGQILALLDTELLENERNDKEILLRQTRSNLALLKIESEALTIKEERLKQTLEKDSVQTARCKALLDLASRNLQRYDELVKKNVTPLSEYEIKLLEKENSDRDCALKMIETKTLQIDLQEIRNSQKNLAARVTQTELAVEQATEALKRATTNLGYARILAPITGVVLERTVDTGQTIAAQFQTPDLFKIAADLKVVYVRALIDEVDVSRVRIGQQVTFETDSFRGKRFTGTVKTLHFKHEAKANLVSYPVVVEAQNPPTADHPLGELRPGMTAFLDFKVREAKDVLRLPAAATRYKPVTVVVPAAEEKIDDADDEEEKNRKSKPGAPATEKQKPLAEKPQEIGLRATVYIKDEKGAPKAVHVKIGDYDGKFYEVLSTELKAGDEVIVGEK